MRCSVAASILISIICFCWPQNLSAEDIETSSGIWDFDSIAPQPESDQPDSPAKTVYKELSEMIEQWNIHDLDGYLEHYWKSPRLAVVVDSGVYIGWQELRDTYKRGYADVNQMGSAKLSRVKVQLIHPDLAFALSYWTVTFPNSKNVVVGINTDFLRRFDNGWRITISHTSTADM
jgi:hypothetical protein